MNIANSPTASRSQFSYSPYLDVPEFLCAEPPAFAAADAIEQDRELLIFVSELAERGVIRKITRPRIILYSGTLAFFAQYFIIWDILS